MIVTDSDIESGFDSDAIVPKKSQSLMKKGREQPRKQVGIFIVMKT